MTLLEESKSMTAIPRPPRRFKYHVLFSYASEEKRYVQAVHQALPKDVEVFNYAKDSLWGKPLLKTLKHIYKREAPFCVVFFSKAYLARSRWTKKELAIVQRIAEKKPGYMLPFVLDGDVPEEIKDIVWLDKKNFSPDQLAERIVAKICEPPPKPWWFYLSTEVKAAAAAALLALIVALILIQPSRTKILSADANAKAITAHLVNIGPKSATVVGQRLKFGALPIEDAELGIDNNRIAPGVHDVTLTTMEILTKCNDDGIRPNKHKVEGLLDQQPAKLVTLEVDIQESNDAPGRSTRQVVTLPAARLKPLVERLVSGRDTQCP
jgi:hypothetical protein